MEILEAYDATGCAHSAAALAAVDPKTVRHYVAKRDSGIPVGEPATRPKLIDPFVGKIEEAVESSQGQVRADVLHERLEAMGFTGDERTTRRAAAKAKAAYRDAHRRSYRPWITEPGVVAAVRLGRRADRVRPRWEAAAHDAVLRLVGVVAVPGGLARIGTRTTHAALTARQPISPSRRP